MKCDNCKKKNQGRYRLVEVEGKLIWLCWECLEIPQAERKDDRKMFEHISTPFFVHAGMKPNAQDKAKMKYMKEHNMSWGDLRREQDAKYAKHASAFPQFQKHYEKYGNKNAPETRFSKEH